jgi:succinoglycan biosynthesis transport protein ExoP
MANINVLEKGYQFDIAHIAAACRSRWATIASTAILCTAAAMTYAVIATPSYRATAKLMIDSRQQKILTSEEVLPGLASDASAIETQVELLLSTRIAQRVLNEMSGAKPAEPDNDLEVQRFLSYLTVARKGLTYVVDISYSAPSADQAADIANRIARAYIAEESDSIKKITERANDWLKERIKTVGPELMSLEKAILDSKAAQGFISIGDQTVAERDIIDYIAQLGMARAAMAEAEAKLEFDQSKSNVSLQSQDAFEIAKAKVSLMERGLRSLSTELINHRMAALQEQDLERDATAARNLYDSLLKRQRETEVQQNLATVNARLIQEALPPAFPSWPRKSLLLLSGLLLGIMLGVFIVVSGELFSQKTVSNPSRQSNLY